MAFNSISIDGRRCFLSRYLLYIIAPTTNKTRNKVPKITPTTIPTTFTDRKLIKNLSYSRKKKMKRKK